jgi:hypothetical protein
MGIRVIFPVSLDRSTQSRILKKRRVGTRYIIEWGAQDSMGRRVRIRQNQQLVQTLAAQGPIKFHTAIWRIEEIGRSGGQFGKGE